MIDIKVELELEIMACPGIYCSIFGNVIFPEGYDFAVDYPFPIHGKCVHAMYNNYPHWTKLIRIVGVDGTICPNNCNGTILVEGGKVTPTRFSTCSSLDYCQPLL